MPARGSGRTHGRGSARLPRGFSLMEVLIALGMVSVALGAATVLLVKAHKRMKRAAEAADERASLGLAADKLLMDVRASSGAVVTKGGDADGALVLTRPDGTRLTWSLVEGSPVRSGPGGDVEYIFKLAGLRFAVEERGGRAVLVEAVLEPETARGKVATPVYVGASPRAWGGGE